MKIKIIFLFILLVISLYTSVSAEEKNHALIIYTADESDDLRHVRILDTIISHFTSDITTKSHEETINIDEYSQVFYVGFINKKLPTNLIEQMENYKGKVVFFGNNVEQLKKRYDFVSTTGTETIHSVSIANSTIKSVIEETRSITKLIVGKNQTILAFGDETKPLIIKDNNSYYVGTTIFHNPVDMVIGEALYDVFEREPKDERVKYLRLEDIHPKTDVKNLKNIATYLKNQEIPYLMAVIPVYTSPSTKEEIRLSDVPELVEVLQYMQKNGASLILHGYKHQYRENETGEGFEFWDVENNRPVYQAKEDEIVSATNEDEQVKLEDFEREYFLHAIQNGVEEMVSHRLYPLAFEAPHYSMSQAGYEILSEYFSTYVGHLQITDQSWKETYGPITSGKPSYLHGMTLIPVTMGYIDRNIQNSNHPFEVSLTNMKSMGEDVSQYSDAYLAAFYHPYLGLDPLKEVLRILNSFPNTRWLDLKQLPNEVKVDDVLIQSKNGEVTIEKELISSEYEKNLFVKNAFKFLLIFGGLLFTLVIYFFPSRIK